MNMNFGDFVPVQVVGAPERDAILRTQGRLISSDFDMAADSGHEELVKTVVASFRRHGHICNVLTHISGVRWDRVEKALRAILDPQTGWQELDPLAENIVDLLCADSGVTGRTMKPYFESLLAAQLPPEVAARIRTQVVCLFDELEFQRRERFRLSREVEE